MESYKIESLRVNHHNHHEQQQQQALQDQSL
jgi:hypothetical protein